MICKSPCVLSVRTRPWRIRLSLWNFLSSDPIRSVSPEPSSITIKYLAAWLCTYRLEQEMFDFFFPYQREEWIDVLVFSSQWLSFWFSYLIRGNSVGSLCPIVLYEYGAWWAMCRSPTFMFIDCGWFQCGVESRGLRYTNDHNMRGLRSDLINIDSLCWFSCLLSETVPVAPREGNHGTAEPKHADAIVLGTACWSERRKQQDQRFGRYCLSRRVRVHTCDIRSFARSCSAATIDEAE